MSDAGQVLRHGEPDRAADEPEPDDRDAFEAHAALSAICAQALGDGVHLFGGADGDAQSLRQALAGHVPHREAAFGEASQAA